VVDTNYSLILMKMMKGPLSEEIGIVTIPSDWEDELPSYAVCNNELFYIIIVYVFCI
jgi:hypothetical protein